MSETTSRLSLPLIAAGQAQKHVTHNEALGLLDRLVQLAVRSRALSTPPADAVEGEMFIVAPGGADAWAGQDDALACLEGTSWIFLPPRAGWRAWVIEEGRSVAWDGTAWVDAEPARESLARLGVNATADDYNRLIVSADGSLLTHAGAGHRLTINKAAPQEVASLSFQDGWVARAEIGLAGDDNLSVKVSDGSSWRTALTVDAATGDLSASGTIYAGRLEAASDAGPDMILPLDNHHATPASTRVELRVGGQVRFSAGVNETAGKFALTAYDATGAWMGDPISVQYPAGQTLHDVLCINASGNVGVGTWPNAKLDVAGVMRLAPLTIADLPAPDAGLLAFVSDAAGGPTVAFADGTGWYRLTDGQPLA